MSCLPLRVVFLKVLVKMVDVIKEGHPSAICGANYRGQKQMELDGLSPGHPSYVELGFVWLFTAAFQPG